MYTALPTLPEELDSQVREVDDNLVPFPFSVSMSMVPFNDSILAFTTYTDTPTKIIAVLLVLNPVRR